MQQKPPSKEQILLEWFMGDAQEILAEQKKTMAEAVSLQKAITEASVSINTVIDKGRLDLVEGHREIQKQIQELEAREKAMLVDLHKRLRSLMQNSTNRSTVTLLIASIVGGALGAAGAVFVMIRLIGMP